MSLIFVDECGWTGQDLLNPKQPVLALATLRCGERDCREMKDRFFARVKSAELKHVALAKRSGQQRMVLEFLDHLSARSEVVKLCIAHKKYTLTTKMVDLVIVPAAAKDGLDLLADGTNTVISSTYFNLLPEIGGQDFFDDLLMRFYELMLARTPDAYRRFFEPLLNDKYPDRLDKLLFYLCMGHHRLGMDELFKSSSRCLDIAMDCTFALMAQWREALPQREDITLIHDDSSEMARNRLLWELLVDPKAPATELVFGSNHKLTFPVGVRRTRPADSANWAGLQLADVVAGAAARHARWHLNGERQDDEYGRQLDEVIPRFMRPAFMIWPSDSMAAEDVDRLYRMPPLPPFHS